MTELYSMSGPIYAALSLFRKISAVIQYIHEPRPGMNMMEHDVPFYIYVTIIAHSFTDAVGIM